MTTECVLSYGMFLDIRLFMIVNGLISVLRKLRSRWVEGSIFLLGLSVSFILLINGFFYRDWPLIVFSIVVAGALQIGEQPLISKTEIRLHKAFGASNYNIWSHIISQSAVKALIITLISLALSGANSFDEILPLSTLFTLRNLWVLPAVLSLFIILISLFHFRVFSQTKPSFSVN